MLRKIRRRYERLFASKRPAGSNGRAKLQLENLERRLLLDTAGIWDILGYRGAEGGGVSIDPMTDAAEAELVLSVDGDPVIFWVEGTLEEYVGGPSNGSGRVMFHWQTSGPIYARQYGGEDIGWWDLRSGSGDPGGAIGTGSELDAAAGPNGEIALTWVDGGNIYVSLWDGNEWADLGSASGGPASEKPSIAISNMGEIFVSYTAIHPNSSEGQRDIVVKKYGDLGWTELISDEVGLFGENLDGSPQKTGGVSNDDGDSFDSSVAIDLEGRPIVAWMNSSWQGGGDICVKRWNGQSWGEWPAGSASDPDNDGNWGISNDSTMSLQPDIAVSDDGDVIVTWVNWQDWDNYDSAGVFVKVLHSGSVWEAYAAGSASGAGIAQDSGLGAGMADLGWYYSPKIDLDSSGQPFIVWQGYGEGERNTANRTGDTDGDESPLMSVYASHYDSGSFDLLYSNSRGVANQGGRIAWMPTGLVGANDELIMAYTWHDSEWDEFHHDDEILVRYWDTNAWLDFGRGAGSNGNELVGNFPTFLSAGDEIQMGVIDYDGDPSTEMDVMASLPDTSGGNNSKLYLYRRDIDEWTNDTSVSDISFGWVHDLRGDPNPESNVNGAPLLAYLDDLTRLPYVYKWTEAGWNLVGGVAAGSAGTLNNEGISVQAGPNETIMLAYTKDVLSHGVTTGQIVTRLWDPVVGSWADADLGTLPVEGGKEAAYFANFDGFDWDGTSWNNNWDDHNGDVNEGQYNDDNIYVYEDGDRVYDEPWGWYFWDLWNPLNDGEISELVEGGTSDEAGRLWVNSDGDDQTGGLEIVITVPEDDPVSGLAGTSIVGNLDHFFRLINDGYINVELSYSLDAQGIPGDDSNPGSENIDLEIRLVVDGVDCGQIATVSAGEMIGYSDATEWHFDSKTFAGGPLDLSFGWHTVGIYAVAMVQEIPDLSFTFDDGGINGTEFAAWVPEPDPPEANAVYTCADIDVPVLGGVDGNEGILLTLGPAGATQAATYTFTRAGDITVDFYYELDTAALEAGDTLALFVELDGEEDEVDRTDLEIISTGGASNIQGYYHHTFTEMAPGEHTLTLRGELVDANDNETGTIGLDSITISATGMGVEQVVRARIDNFAVYQRVTPAAGALSDSDTYDFNAGAEGWVYADVSDVGGVVDGGYDGGGGTGVGGSNGLEMTLGDGVAGEEDMSGAFSQTLNLADSQYTTITFSYNLIVDQNVAAGETLSLYVTLDGTALGTFQVTGTGTGTVTSGWQEEITLNAGMLSAGNHTLSYVATLTNSDVNVEAQGWFYLDDVEIDYYSTYGRWEFPWTPNGNVGGNTAVGPGDNGTFNFQSNIHSILTDTGALQSQEYRIEDIVQAADGTMEISFRYRLTGSWDADIQVFVDAVECDSEDPIDHPLPLAWADSPAWYNGIDDDQEYTWVRAVGEDIAAGSHTVRIVVSGTGETELWIDNLTILASEPTDLERPIATLLGIGSDGTRPFSVTVLNRSEGLRVYANAEQDSDGVSEVWPDSTIGSYGYNYGEPAFLGDGYTTSTVYQLNNNEWTKYGSDIKVTQGIDCLGVASGEAAAMVQMPGSTVMIVADIAIGPGGLPWLAVYEAQTDWVDTSDPADGVPDLFEIHWVIPISGSEGYWTMPYTVLDSQILAWMNAPADPRGNANFVPHWEDMGFTPTAAYHGYTELELVSSGGKRPAVAWTQRDENGFNHDVAAMRWEDGVWGVLGNVESVQNDVFWSSANIMEMIVMPGSDSDPIVAYYMGHLDCYGIREFLAGTDIPQMVVSEESGTINDDLLEFGATTISYVDQSFSVTNAGQVDLTICGIEMGGYGDLASNPFSLWPPGLEFPISLASGESKGFVVRFDPTGVPAGYYDSVLVVHTNMPTHPTHPFAHFYELSMHVEVDSQTGMDVNDLSFVYDDTIINGGWIPDLSGKFQQEFTVATPGDVNLGFDYQLLLGEQLTSGETLDLLVSVDGVDVTSLGDYQIVGGDSQDSDYLSVVLTLNDLTAGGHVLAIQGELSRSTGGVIGGTGTMRLDNITLAGASWNFNLYPGVGVWEFTGDTENPDATDGNWNKNSGVSGSGGLETVLGDPLEIKELIITNTGESDLTIFEWGFGGTAFRILNVAEDGVAGAVISRHQADGSYDEENISSENMVGASDDVVLQPDDFLTLMIVFEPTEIRENGFSDTLRIVSNNINNEYVAVTLSGIGVSGARIGVEVDGESVADYDPITEEYDQIDFGSVIKGQSGQVEVTIRNNGSSDLTLLSVVENNIPPELEIWPVLDNYVLTPKGTPGDEVVVTLTYTPSISEEENDRSPVALETMLAITSDDPDLADRLFTIEVVGLGVPQIPMVELINMDTGEPMDPHQLDFGNVYIGSPNTKTFQVKNIGGAQLRIERFQIEHKQGTGTNLFVVAPQNLPNEDSDDIILAYGSDPYTITVTFTPTEAGVGWDKLHILYYDNGLKETTVNLIGTGIGQKLEVTDSWGNPGDGQIDFESVGQGQTAVQTITLTNAGSSSLTITGWTLTGDTDEFSLVNASGQIILGPGSTQQIGVEFTPSSATGSFSGTVTIVSNDPESPVTVTLTGAGATPGQVEIDTESLNFGSLVVGSSATESFTIRNDGSSNLLVTGIEVDSLYFTLDTLLDPDDDSDDITLVPGQERVVSVTFMPVNMFDTRTMDQPPTVVVTTDDQSGDGPVETTVTLRGQSILTSQVSGGKLLWTDSNNNIIQIVVSSGTASVLPVDGNNRDIGKIELSGTSTKSVLTVTGPKSGARIGQITGEILKNIVLKNITLDGDMNDDGLEDNDNAIEVDVLTGMLKLGNIVNGADITISNTLGKGAKISAGVIGDDTDIVVGQGDAQGNVAKFQATSFGLGTLTTDSLAGLKIGKGDFDATVQIDGDARKISLTGTNVAGSFIIGGDLTNLKAANAGFSGMVAAENIGKISFGNMIGAEISVRGELGKLTSRGNMIDSLILAGYNLGEDGQIGTSDDSPASGGRINNVKISGGVDSSYILSGIVPNTAGNFNVFDDPPLTHNMRTGTIGQVRFGDVFDSGPAFGVAAYGNIDKVQVGSIVLTPGASPWDYFQMREF